MKKFDTYEEPIKEYCNKNNIDFDLLENQEVMWGMDMLKVLDKNKNVILVVYGYNMSDLLFEETEYINRYKLNKEMVV